MEELLNKVAEIRGMPASLVERSAAARAEKEGTTVEAVLREWAGEEPGGTAEPAPSKDVAPAASPTPPSPAADEPSAPAALTTDYLVKLAADAKRMPPKLVLSSAEARATNSKTSVDEVLAGWAGTTLEALEAEMGAKQDPVEEPAAAPEPEPAPAAEASAEAPPAAPAAAAAAAVGALSMDELLEKVAEAKGMPAALAKRSAEARAKKTGEPLEAVLAEWAGVDPSSVAAESSAPPPQTEEPKPTAEDTSAAEEPEDAEVEVIEASVTETPAEDELAEDDAPRGRYPAWLAAAFVIIPLLAVAYILVSPNGPDCGTGGQLAIDPVTGLATNCDGSEYGASSVDYFAVGSGVYAQCAACHGTDGGGGAGPAFVGGAVLATFPSGMCATHVEWVALGTAGWPESTYGANNKPVGGGGVMPPFASLSEDQLKAVALYERVQFGGQDLAEAEADCGLVEADESTEALAP